MADETSGKGSPSKRLALSTYEIRLALAKHRRDQMYRLATLRDSAVMAAFQTVDVRLKQLELASQPKQATVEDLIWEAAIAGCFNVAGGLIEKGLAEVFTSILKTRLAFAVAPKTDLGLWVKNQHAKEWDRLVGQYKRQLADKSGPDLSPLDRIAYREIVDVTGRDIKLFQKGFLDQPEVRLLYHDMTFKVVDPLIKSASNVTEMSAKLKRLVIDPPASQLDSADIDSSDTPMVRMLRSALEFFNRQIETQNRVIDEFDLALSSNRYGQAELDLFANILIPGTGIAGDVTDTADEAQSLMLNLDVWIRYFEFCVWVMLFPETGGITKVGSNPQLKNVPVDLQEYLIRRLFVGSKVPGIGRPLTILEHAIVQSRNNRVLIRALSRTRTSGPGDDATLTSAIVFSREQAIMNLHDAWALLASNMNRATQQLYARSGA